MVLPFFIATYTTPGGSQGIYRSALDLETGALEAPLLAAATPNPSYLALSPDGSSLACVNEQSPGTLTLFKIGAEFRLSQRATIALTGQGPCFVQFAPDGQSLLTASYGSGDFETVALDGRTLWKWSAAATSSPAAHAHCLKSLPGTPWSFGTDLGQNLVISFRNGIMVHQHTLQAGSPRHFAFNPTENCLYVGSEYGSSITVLQLDRESGSLAESQTVSTLPARFQGENSTAEVLTHPSGKWLYVSNRGHDSIACFPIHGDGSLGGPAITQIGVQTPRGLAIDPTGAYLLAAGQSDGKIVSLKIDPINGIPAASGPMIKVSKPVHMLFGP